MADVLMRSTGSPSRTRSISQCLGKDVGWFMVQTLLTAACAGSPTVFILNAAVLESPTREQSEERVSSGAEPGWPAELG